MSGVRDSVNEMRRYGQALVDAAMFGRSHEDGHVKACGTYSTGLASRIGEGSQCCQRATWLRNDDEVAVYEAKRL